MSFALLDADVIVYRSAAGAQEDWGGEIVCDARKAIDSALEMAQQWWKLSKCQDVLLCLTDRTQPTFRHTLSPAYKAGRVDKPVAYWKVLDALEENFPTRRIVGLEADDVMGILATEPKADKPVIVSIDKDLLTVPGRLLNPDKAKKPWRISKHAANLWWMQQSLMGDSTDGYKGCPGIGPKRALQLLAGCPDLSSMWAAVKEAFGSRGLDEAEALLNVRLARILRSEDIDTDHRRIQLWHHTTPEWMTLSQTT